VEAENFEVCKFFLSKKVPILPNAKGELPITSATGKIKTLLKSSQALACSKSNHPNLFLRGDTDWLSDLKKMDGWESESPQYKLLTIQKEGDLQTLYYQLSTFFFCTMASEERDVVQISKIAAVENKEQTNIFTSNFLNVEERAKEDIKKPRL